jgi:hypothetical protein
MGKYEETAEGGIKRRWGKKVGRADQIIPN